MNTFNSYNPFNQNTITFGKYRNQNLEKMLKDRKYCQWLVEQDFFKNSYEYLYNRIKEYKPLFYFLKSEYQNNIKIKPEVKEVKEVKQNNLESNLENNLRTNVDSDLDEILFISSIDELKSKKSKANKDKKGKKDFDLEQNLDPNLKLPYFLENYAFFNLRTIHELESKNILHLEEYEKQCYEYYLEMINNLRQQVINNISSNQDNIYNITAPVKWLQIFEQRYCMSRDLFKEFIASYDLPNIPSIIEDIKEQGGLVYKGGKSFLIAKERSKEQENYWEKLLKNKYGENIGSQYKYEKCIFDFINIQKNIIYECKLSLKDFDEEQFKKYKLVLGIFNIIYLISTDCAININEQKIYTTNSDKYSDYISNIYDNRNPTYLDTIIEDFSIIECNNIENIMENV